MRFWGANSDRDWDDAVHEHDEPEPVEPGDDQDGEVFRGGEAAAYESEQMAAAQRLK